MTAQDSRPPLPRWRWCPLFLGTLLILCVYYLNYGGFHEGSGEGSNPAAVPIRLAGVLLIAGSLAPYRAKQLPAVLLLLVFYTIAALSFLFAVGMWGELNDLLFVNTLAQLPVLWAVCQTRWRVDHARWLRFIGNCLLLQAAVDLLVFIEGRSLWLSEAFVGGFGNPSSFGLSCVVLSVFFLFHPGAGSYRLPKAMVLALAAIMSKSLFAALSASVVFAFWAAHDRRRLLVGAVAVAALGTGITWWASRLEQEVFLLHKLSAAIAFVGLIDYDVDTSATVAVRSEMHARTFAAIAADPGSFLSGHLEGRAYWPIDSQVLTYLGSFGIVLLTVFAALHLIWMRSAFRRRKFDGKFSLVALGVFGFIFFTNRILDYFPVATLYFLCIAIATSEYAPWTPRRQETDGATIDGQSC